jgi:hypothetical protein
VGGRATAPLLLLLLAALLGALIVDDFGPSWDETYNDKAGARAIQAYYLGNLLQDQHDNYIHGTFYFMLYSGLSRSLASSPLGRLVVRHYVNYLTFLMALASMYFLVNRLLGRRAALLTVVLMMAQPLYFGYAFINQKDIPFLSFFTTSIALGVSATAALVQSTGRPAGDSPASSRLSAALASMQTAWRSAGGLARFVMVLLCVVCAALIYGLLAERIVYPWMQDILNQAYVQQGPPWAYRLFQAVAQDAHKTPLEDYQRKLHTAYGMMTVVAIPIAVAALVMAWRRLIGPTPFWLPFIRDPAHRRLLLAGAFLGFTSAIRVIGPFAGLLVGLYMLTKLQRRAPAAILVYGLTGAAVTYLAWPALWGDPLNEFWSRLTGSIQFDQPHDVLFEGVIYNSLNLPIRYLPKLLAMQFSLPVLLAVPAGLFAAGRWMHRKQLERALIALLILWFGLPFAAQILLAVPLYGNMRQMLFMTVPLVAFAGMGWELVLRSVKGSWAPWIAAALIIAPGANHMIRFHPYEYVYYNELVGGVEGAAGRYELDLWCTSYGELVKWLNLHAPRDSRVVAWGPVDGATEFTREDLQLEPIAADWESADYRMACGKGLLDETFFAGTEPYLEVRRAGVLLGKLSSGQADG